MPTTFQIREILARHANIINIFITSFCQEKYRVGISLLYSVLILLNSENPLRFLRIAVDMRILFSCSYYLLILRPAFSWYQPPVNCVLWQYSQLGQSSFHHAHATYLPTYQSVRELDNFIFYLNHTSSQNWDAWICGFDPSFSPSLPLYISHLLRQFSDAELDLLITNFLLLFVACCSTGFCKISRLSGYPVARVR